MKRTLIIVLVLIIAAVATVPALAAKTFEEKQEKCERKGKTAVFVGYKQGDPDRPQFRCEKGVSNS